MVRQSSADTREHERKYEIEREAEHCVDGAHPGVENFTTHREEGQQYQDTVATDLLVAGSPSCRQQVLEHMRPIQRWYGQQVEKYQYQVEENAHPQHLLGDRCSASERFHALSDDPHGNNQECEHHNEYRICRHARERYDDVAPLEVAEVARNNRNRLGAAEYETSCVEGHDRQQDRHERIYVPERVPREAPQLEGGVIALGEGGVPVCVLVCDHREQQNGR